MTNRSIQDRGSTRPAGNAVPAASILMAAAVLLAGGTARLGADEGAPAALSGGSADRAVLGRIAPPPDSADVAAVVDRFHEALASGDSAAAMALLADDATVLESGGVETRAEYAGHHLGADMEFASAVARDRGDVSVTVEGDVAWTVSTSTAEGEFRGRGIRSQGAELMVLRRGPEGWKIAAIHWSSRPLRESDG